MRSAARSPELPSITTAPRAVLSARRLAKTYPALTGDGPGLARFRDLDLDAPGGEMVAVVGRSGAGKSSLLHLLAGLERPTSGDVWVKDQALSALSGRELSTLRNQAIGYVWQFHYLLPEFTAEENVAMPLLARGMGRQEAAEKARRWLDRVELASRPKHRSGELSGGEQQRVALARALVTGPAVLLADEPTGDLDDETAMNLFSLLQQLCREDRLATVLVTHNTDLAQRCDRVLRLTEGRLEPVGSADLTGR